MNEYEQIKDWLLGYTPLGNWLYFNVMRMEIGSSSIQSVPGSTIITQYNNGSCERELIFAVSLVKLYDAGMSENNIDAIAEVKALSDWIEEQTTLPDFGTDYIVNSVDILDHVPNLTIDQESNTCSYLFQCSVNYLEL